MSTLVHTLHAVLAGTWLGGVAFTTFVVSPALQAMGGRCGARPGEVQDRQAVREGRRRQPRTARVVRSLRRHLRRVRSHLYAEYALLAGVAGSVAGHAAYFGRRLVALAAAEQNAPDADTAASFARRRQSLQKFSLRASRLDLLLSAAIAVLAVNA